MDINNTTRKRQTTSLRRNTTQVPQNVGRKRRARNIQVDEFDGAEPIVNDIGGNEEQTNIPAVDHHTDIPDVDHPTDKPGSSEGLATSFPGGPIDPSILKNFSCHVAAKIWNNEERDLLRCLNHGSKVANWSLTSEAVDNSKFVDIIKHSGLYSLTSYLYKFVNKLAVSTFVERWQPETNSFHMPFGEMFMSLDAVSTILGIPVTSTSVLTKLSRDEAAKVLVKSLGVLGDDAVVELKGARGQSV
ncbi:unnamed protein product [Camellia sinensis]